MLQRLYDFLRTRIIAPLPPGIVPDVAANFGLFGLWNNVNNYAESLSTVVTAGTNSTLTVAQLLSGVTNLTAGASGGFTITLPATSAIISGLGPTIKTDGSYAIPISFLNNAVGQTGTVTAGDASTTVTGTATVATSTRRLFLLTVNSPTTITLQNLGTISL